MQPIKNNKIYLRGAIQELPMFDHQLYGEDFYTLKLQVARLSESFDVLPVTLSGRLFAGRTLELGQVIAIEGQLRSYNKHIDGANRLVLTVFARDLHFDGFDGESPNHVELTCTLCKPPIYRMTPFKREISDLLVAVNRAYGKSDYIPCIAWGRNARFCESLNVGDHLEIHGRMQSRAYQKRIDENTVLEKVAFEVSVTQLVRLDDTVNVNANGASENAEEE